MSQRVQTNAKCFLAGTVERRRTILHSLGSGYVLAGQEVRVEVDPLLEAVVRFARFWVSGFRPRSNRRSEALGAGRLLSFSPLFSLVDLPALYSNLVKHS